MNARMAQTAVLVLAAAALVSAQVPAGGEFQVNSSTTADQAGPSVAVDRAGRFVVVWTDLAPGAGIRGQRFDAAGARLGGELQVTSYATQILPTFSPDVTVAAGGAFVVGWFVDGPTSVDMVIGQRFNAAGAHVGAPFVVTDLRGRSPALATQPSSDFIVVWPEDTLAGSARDIWFQRFAASGTRLGAELRANTYTTFHQMTNELAVDGAGNFVVVWRSNTQDGSGEGIFGQRFGAQGTALGAEFRVNSYTPLNQEYAAVASGADGAFVVVWASDGQDGSGSGVFGQRFDAAGNARGAEFQVNGYTSSHQLFPSVAADAAGNFVVAWTSDGQDGDGYGVFARRFTAAGAARGVEFRVNALTSSEQFAGEVASDAAGNFVVTWSALGQDGSGYGVFAQRFGGLRPAALAVNTTGNGVFEPGEVVDVVPSWRNVNGTGQSFGGSALSFTGPQPATYQIQTAFANYGFVANGITRACVDCYRVMVPTLTRPVLHWDAVFDERLTPDVQGQEMLWRLHVGGSFTDVPTSSAFYRFVETLLHHGITGGCTAMQYCPTSSTARDQMAVFALVAKEGAAYRPPACTTPMFPDVPASSPFCPFIEELARRGVVSGCGGGNYCPAASVSREQMPVFVLRTLDPALDPPACTTPMFADVPASSPFCRWIEELARRGVVTGCGGGNYCPADAVTREQMGVFIAGTFGLTLYGP
jgi:hypothetical protein